MGSVYAGLMQLAGHDVHGVCLWPDHVEAVNAHGLRVHGASGDHTVRLASMATSTARIGVSDLVVIATKAFDVETAAESCRPLIGPTTVIQSIQNGLGSPEKIAKILGAERLAIGVAGGFGASVPEPGVAHHNGMEMVRFGSRSLPRPDLEASATIWTSSGFTVKLYEDTDQMVWEKFIMNVAFSGTSCATGLSIGEVMANPSAWAVAEACAREAVAVAHAAGIRLDVGDPIAHVRSLGARSPTPDPRCCSTSTSNAAAKSTPSSARSQYRARSTASTRPSPAPSPTSSAHENRTTSGDPSPTSTHSTRFVARGVGLIKIMATAGALAPTTNPLAPSSPSPRSGSLALALRLAYMMLARVLSWLALLTDPTRRRTSRSWCSVPRSPCYADTTHTPH